MRLFPLWLRELKGQGVGIVVGNLRLDPSDAPQFCDAGLVRVF